MHALTFAVTALLSLTSAIPLALPEPYPTTPNTIRPTTLSHYTVWSGAISYAVPHGKVFKDGRTSDITTLVQFTIPSSAAGKTCSLKWVFEPSDTVAKISGSRKVDIFKSQAYPTGSTTGWPPGNRRGEHLGRLVFDESKVARYEDVKTVESFPCPPAGEWPVEIVGVYDAVNVEWDGSVSGPYISY